MTFDHVGMAQVLYRSCTDGKHYAIKVKILTYPVSTGEFTWSQYLLRLIVLVVFPYQKKIKLFLYFSDEVQTLDVRVGFETYCFFT